MLLQLQFTCYAYSNSQDTPLLCRRSELFFILICLIFTALAVLRTAQKREQCETTKEQRVSSTVAAAQEPGPRVAPGCPKPPPPTPAAASPSSASDPKS